MSSAAQQDVGCDESEEEHGDDSVQREECGVHSPHIFWRDDGVLVAEQDCDYCDSGDGQLSEAEERDQPEQHR